MKRFLSLFIVLVLLLSTLASCDWFMKPEENNGGEQSTTTPTTPTTPTNPSDTEADIQEAVNLLDDMYEDLNGTSIADGYEIIAQIPVGKTVFSIEWTSDNENVTFTYNDGLYVINLGAVLSDVEYTITGKLTSEGGQEATVSYTLILSAAASGGMIKNPEIGKAYKLALRHGGEDGDPIVYFDGNNYNNYAWYFSYTTDVMASVDVYLEEVENVEGGLRLYFMKDDVKTYIVAYPRDGDTTKGTLKFDTAVPTEYYTFDTERNILVYTSTTGEQFYLGSSGTYKSISCSAISYLNSATSYPCYLFGPGGDEIKLPEAQLPVLPDNYTTDDVIEALFKLEPGQQMDVNFTVTGVITGFKYDYDPSYGNVSPKITVNGKEFILYRIKGEGADTIKVGDTITVFATGIQNYNGEYETLQGGEIKSVVPGTGEVPTPTPEKMTIPEVLASAEGTSVVVSGTVSEIYQAWSDQFNNISFYISDDQGNRLLVFRTGTKVVVGDQVTVTGETTLYNGTIQIAQGGTTVIDVPAGSGSDSTLVPTIVTTPAVDTAYKFGMIQGNLDNAVYYLAGGMAQTYYLASTTNYDAAIDLYLEAADNGYYLYTMVDGVKTYVNMVVSGTHVNGAYEATPSTVYTWDATNNTIIASVTPEGGEAADYWFGTRNDKTYTTVGPCAVSYAGFFCQFYTLSENNQGGEDTHEHVFVDGKCECGEEDPNYQPPTGGEDETVMTIPEVLASAEGTAVVVKGTVVEIYQSWNDQYSNISFYIGDEAGNKLLVFRTGTKVNIGDQVTVTGKATVYSGTIQIAQGGTTVIDVAHVCSEYTEGSCTIDSVCVVCGKVGTSAPGHTYVDGSCSACGAAEPQGDVLPGNLIFTSAANKASADSYLTTNFPEWKITGKLGQTYGGYLGFGRSGDSSSAITSPMISVSNEFTITTVLKGNGSSGVATSTLTFTLVDKDGNTVATGYANGSSTAAITPVDAKDTTYTITFTFVEGKTWTDVSNLVVTFAKATGNIGLKSLDFVQ